MIDAGDRAVLAMLRQADGERLLVLANLAAREAAIDLSAVDGVDADGAVDILSGATVGAASDLALPALGLMVLRLP